MPTAQKARHAAGTSHLIVEARNESAFSANPIENNTDADATYENVIDQGGHSRPALMGENMEIVLTK